MMLARRINLRPVLARPFSGKLGLGGSWPANVHTINESETDLLAVEQNPDRNIEYVNSAHDPMCARPFMLGMPGTELATLREREKGHWGDLSIDDQRKLFRGAYKSTFPEMLQGTDMWKGTLGVVFLYYGIMCWIMFYSFYWIHDEKPCQSGLWFMYHDGWQQHRKNEAAFHLFWENETIECRGDVAHWDWQKHCWKAPQTLRWDEEL